MFREPSLKNILAEATQVCAVGLDVPFCKISRFREDDNDFIVEAGYGWDDHVVGQVVTKCDEATPHGRTFITGKPVLVADLANEPTIILPSYYARHKIVSIIDVIIKGKEGPPYGILEIDSPVLHTYDKHDVHFLTGFANVLAEAVAAANRNQIIRDNSVRMESLVAEKDQALADLSEVSEELKHRVRNNLQLIHTMLASHIKMLPRTQERTSIYAIMRRVMSLAQVYEQLLGSGMTRVIELGNYLKALCTSLPDLQQGETSGVQLTCDVVPMLVDIDTATALGMVVAELVSNCFEHAFSGSSAGSVQVKLIAAENEAGGVITIGDDGKGFIEQPGSKRHGVGLVRRLMKQIQGEAEMQPGQGSMWILRFPLTPFGQDAAAAPARSADTGSLAADMRE